MAHRFDATMKDMFAEPKDFTTVFDLPKVSPACALNVDLSTISAATDVAFGFGAPLQEIVDLNFQSFPDALREIVHEIDRRLSTEAEHARAVRLMTASFILTGLRVEMELLATIYDGVRVMHESTAFDYWVGEGERRGEIRGEIRGLHRFLLLLGNDRFGAADPATETALRAIENLERLERMAHAMFIATSWQELLAIE